MIFVYIVSIHYHDYSSNMNIFLPQKSLKGLALAMLQGDTYLAYH